jgi:hypothetical protein
MDWSDRDYARRYDLICEGPCNPRLSTLDERVKQERRVGADGFLTPITERLTQELRGLVHTTHVATDAYAIFLCTACKTTRRYGYRF